MLVTPLTDFKDIHSFLETLECNKQSQTYHQRPSDGSFQSTRIYAYSIGAIFEMIPGKQESINLGIDHSGSLVQIQLF